MNPNNMQDLLRNISRMRKDMEKAGDDLRERYVEAEAGGGLVELVFNGQQEPMKISIDPKLVTPGDDGKVDVELLEDLLLAAISQGVEKSKALMKEEMDQASGGMGGAIPGLF